MEEKQGRHWGSGATANICDGNYNPRLIRYVRSVIIFGVPMFLQLR